MAKIGKELSKILKKNGMASMVLIRDVHIQVFEGFDGSKPLIAFQSCMASLFAIYYAK